MSGMPGSIRRRFERYRSAPLTWLADGENRRPTVCWVDERREVLCEHDVDFIFEEIAGRMLGGRYYPPDTLDFFGEWMDENRPIRAGDRILQRARVLPFSQWPVLWAMTEVFVAERTPSTCAIGYVTTKRHFGRGIWQASLTKSDRGLELSVSSTSSPYSWLFWIGLPIARRLQLRAWRRAFEEYKSLCAKG
ncbi:MAG TPA: DUF1990 family protein [Fimbriimonadaceae bacterium]|nr:DUF1990 family protein [Fimbriimonadaceae bacterium]